MFKKFFELMARKIFKRKSFSWVEQKKAVKSMEEGWKKNLAKGKQFDGSPKTPRRPEEDWLNPEVQRKGKRGIASGKLKGKLSKEDVQRSQRQRKSVKKYRETIDKEDPKWSPSRGLGPPEVSFRDAMEKKNFRKHIMNTPGASLVGAGTAASLTRNKKRKK